MWTIWLPPKCPPVPLMLHCRSPPAFFVSVSLSQTDSGCAAPVPSLHCQRIARAKWEFLFGTPAEEAASRGEKSESASHLSFIQLLHISYTSVSQSFLLHTVRGEKSEHHTAHLQYIMFHSPKGLHFSSTHQGFIWDCFHFISIVYQLLMSPFKGALCSFHLQY